MGTLLYGQCPTVKWMSWEQMELAQKKEKRKVFVNIYADWCGWCKRMDATTFKNSDAISALNNSYYAVKFNAQSSNEIVFKDKIYQFKRQGNNGINEFALYLMKANMSTEIAYPTLVYMDENLNVIQTFTGLRSPNDIIIISSYYAGNYQKTMRFESYKEYYLAKHKY